MKTNEDYLAIVRFKDGTKGKFHVHNSGSLDEAFGVLKRDLDNVCCALVVVPKTFSTLEPGAA